jgi:hypothetical protein
MFQIAQLFYGLTDFCKIVKIIVFIIVFICIYLYYLYLFAGYRFRFRGFCSKVKISTIFQRHCCRSNGSSVTFVLEFKLFRGYNSFLVLLK